VKGDRRSRRADDADVRKPDAQSRAKTVQRPEPCQFFRDDRGVRVQPAVEPELREVIDLAVFRGPHVHADAILPDGVAARREPDVKVTAEYAESAEPFLFFSEKKISAFAARSAVAHHGCSANA